MALAETSQFFDNSVANDRLYSSAQMDEMFARTFVGNGVIVNQGNGLVPSNDGTLNAFMDTGECWFNGMKYKNTSKGSLALGTLSTNTSRVDRLVVRFDTVTNRAANAYIIAGTPAASNPATPAVTTSTDMTIGIFLVARGSGSTYTITVYDDRRPARNLNSQGRDKVSGFQVSVAGGSNGFTVSTGWCLDQTYAAFFDGYTIDGKTLNRTTMGFDAATEQTVTKVMTAWSQGFASGTNGALDTGSFTANRLYLVFAILKDSDQSVDFIASYNVYPQQGPTAMPSGYTKFRYIGCVRADSGPTNLLACLNLPLSTGFPSGGSEEPFYMWEAVVSEKSFAADSTTTRQTLTLGGAPPFSIAKLRVQVSESSGLDYGWVMPTSFTDVTPASGNANFTAGTITTIYVLLVPVDNNGGISFRHTNNSAFSIGITTEGFYLKR